MQRAIELARRGEGAVEPNPMVGCVLVRDDEVLGEGWHEIFGGPHAEVNAIRNATDRAKGSLAGATAYVSLEPCSHQGKTPPCCNALIQAQVGRVVVALKDPNPKVAGQGIAALRDAGIEVIEDVLAREAADVLAPYLKRTNTGKPWVIAKWAMTIDGKIATATGDSQWISNEDSRAIVHQIRGRVDAVMVGSGTALADDPMLNARPAGMRAATRIVVDSTLRLRLNSKLATTANEYPTLIATLPTADSTKVERLRSLGCEVWQPAADSREGAMLDLLSELSERGMTNVLVEGGAGLLGLLHQLNQIDEVHGFIGPQLAGGKDALSPISGPGVTEMNDATKFRLLQADAINGDVYCVWRKSD